MPPLLHYLLFFVTFMILSAMVRGCAADLAKHTPERRAQAVGTGQRGLFWLLCLALPWTMPNEIPALRIFATGYAIIFALESHELVRGRVADWQLLANPWGFWLWWLVPLDARLRSKVEQRGQARRQGFLRLGRSLLKLSLAALLFAAHLATDRSLFDPAISLWLMSAWSMFTLYACLSGTADVVTGAAMLTGIEVEEPFDNPWVSRNPSEFWGRRWNRFVTNFARRHVFWPCGGRRKPVRATMAIFIGSGLAHEYIVMCCRPGWSPYFGLTLIFFVLQGFAVILHGRWKLRQRRNKRASKLRAELAIAVHVMWMWVTSPLFFLPLEESLGYLDWF